MKKIIRHLKSIGYTQKVDLIDFWFNNEDECVQKLNSISPNWGNTISCKLRWKTPLGLKLEQAVKDFIKKQADIDFNNLDVTLNNTKKHINYWLYQITTKAGTYQNWTDLRAIDLSNIKIHSAELSNAVFANANFSNAKLNQLHINNCNFPDCCFKNAFIAIIRLKDVDFSNSDFSGAKLNATELGGNISLGRRPKIKKISYLNLLLTAIKAKRPDHKNKHTDFSMITIHPGNDGLEQKHLSYISWYQDSILKYTTETDFFSKIKNFISAATTKNWQSLFPLFCTILIIITLYASIYFFIRDTGFDEGKIPTFIAAIYYSVITFSSLGYGDISPKLTENFALFLVISEVFVGYILLGITIFVLTK